MFSKRLSLFVLCSVMCLSCMSACREKKAEPIASEVVSAESVESVQEVNSDASIRELDLSDITPDQVSETAERLRNMTALEKVELMGSDGTSKLGVDDVRILCAAAPNAVFHFEFELFGKKVSTTDEKIEFVDQKIGNKGEEELRKALDILRGCRYLKLDECGFDSEVLAKVRDDYPDTKIVWRIHIGKRHCLTDTEMVRAVYHFDDTNSYELRYCTDVKYMDLGHNTDMHDISFIEYMPKLEIVILSGSPVSDLSAFRNHDNLIFLEVAYCNFLKDVSPLATCKNLKNLNISFTKVKDVSPLDNVKLERLSYLGSDLSDEEKKDLEKKHPDCWISYNGKQPYGQGWRYDDDGYTYSEIYKKVREVFKYDELTKDKK